MSYGWWSFGKLYMVFNIFVHISDVRHKLYSNKCYRDQRLSTDGPATPLVATKKLLKVINI